MSESPSPGLKLTALSVPDVAKVLSKTAGRTITESMVRTDIGAGAPINPDGTMSLIQYAAWLVQNVRETTHGD